MRRTKAEAQETRQSILLAAERVFFEKGVSDSTLDDVAIEAGVTRGAIYWHFASKKELFLELYNSVPLPQADMLERLQLATTSQTCDTLDCMEQTACDWLDLFARDEQRQRMLTILLRTNYTDDFLAVMEAQQRLDEHHARDLESAFDQARRAGSVNSDWTAQSASRSVRWLIKGMCFEWLLFGKKFDLARDGIEDVRRLFRTFRTSPRQPV